MELASHLHLPRACVFVCGQAALRPFELAGVAACHRTHGTVRNCLNRGVLRVLLRARVCWGEQGCETSAACRPQRIRREAARGSPGHSTVAMPSGAWRLRGRQPCTRAGLKPCTGGKNRTLFLSQPGNGPGKLCVHARMDARFVWGVDERSQPSQPVGTNRIALNVAKLKVAAFGTVNRHRCIKRTAGRTAARQRQFKIQPMRP